MISVIIPTYNRESTITRAIRSVINQQDELNKSYQIEIIIVDDCSSDNTLEIVKKINFKNIKIIALEKNVGANSARNIGIKAATGKYIAFQDSDDEWLPKKLQIQLDIFEKTGSDVVFTNLIRKNDSQIAESRLTNSRKSGFVSFEEFSTNPLMSTQTIIAKSEVLKKNNFLNGLPRLQDWELSLRLSSLGYKCFFVKDILVNQYIQSNSISNNGVAAEQAVDIISQEFQKQFQNKNVKIHGYRLIAESSLNKEKKIEMYKKILKTKFNFKIFLKLQLFRIRNRGEK